MTPKTAVISDRVKKLPLREIYPSAQNKVQTDIKKKMYLHAACKFPHQLSMFAHIVFATPPA